MSMKIAICCTGILLVLGLTTSAQQIDSMVVGKVTLPSKFLSRIEGSTAGLNRQLTRQTKKYLGSIARREERLRQKLGRIDSAAANRLLNNPYKNYSKFAIGIKNETGRGSGKLSGEYMPYIDSLNSSLSFLKRNPQLLRSQAQVNQLEKTVAHFQQLQGKMQYADEVKEFIRQRKVQIGQFLGQYSKLPAGLRKEYQGINEGLYYYSQQIREYKQELADPDRVEKRALALLGQLPDFQQHMKDFGQLAGLFKLPAGYGSPAGLEGLQTTSQVSQQIQSQVAAGGLGAMSVIQQNLRTAEQQLDHFKDKLNGLGSGDIDLPNFRPNNQKTMTFWKRLEYEVNLQTSRINTYYPNILDLGSNVGYRLNDWSEVGIGASFKLGLGSDIRHLSMTASGAGLRSFLEMRIRGSFSATGGLELNHTSTLQTFQDIRKLNSWTRSGLVGITKTIAVKNRVFKKTKISLLWDFLSYQQSPRTMPFLFRVGYQW